MILLIVACQGEQGTIEQTKDDEVTKVPVITWEVASRNLKEFVTITGRLEGIVDVTLTSETSGRIVSLTKDLGDKVSKGEVIGYVDNDDLKIALDQARASVVSAEAALDNARLTLNSSERLYKENTISEAELLRARSGYKSAEAGLMSARAGEESAKKRLEQSRFIAPVSGFIADITVDEGETVMMGTPVCTIVDHRKLIIKTGVPEKDIKMVENGQRVELRNGRYSGPITGTVSAIGIQPTQRTASYPIEITLENPDLELLPGMVVQGSILARTFDNVIYTSLNYILREYDTSYVYVVDEEQIARRKSVELGRQIGEYVILSSGIDTGEFLVIDGYANLEDGTPVDVRRMPSK